MQYEYLDDVKHVFYNDSKVYITKKEKFHTVNVFLQIFLKSPIRIPRKSTNIDIRFENKKCRSFLIKYQK